MTVKEKGFTILEVTIAGAISSIITLGVFGILLASNRNLDIAHAKMSLGEGPREALFKMAQEIRQTAHHKIIDFGDGSNLSGDTINFRIPIPDPDASTLLDVSYGPDWAANIRYSLDRDTHQIIRTSTDLSTGAVKQTVLANNITSLAFSRASATSPIVTIQVSAQQIFPNGRRVPATPVQITTEAEARNP
ncbi:MAG TPA: hypothetical protein PK997_01955 [Candidatus Omnitrophota bacterium]|nr:MAG: hypothetical protein BWY49_00837 [Candidatus Omnitrophica bacterium ADurb.Bin314]HOE69307.1 hypothetical protein [Candidatus Omnitrophota bacterium]HQB93952.1 hypothetical protein [Candidatus Omnitrophota bacterium]